MTHTVHMLLDKQRHCGLTTVPLMQKHAIILMQKPGTLQTSTCYAQHAKPLCTYKPAHMVEEKGAQSMGSLLYHAETRHDSVPGVFCHWRIEL